eukprot:gene22056-23094_t
MHPVMPVAAAAKLRQRLKPLLGRNISFGSGFIFSRDGLIITNAHVVNGAEKVVVTFKNGHKKIASVKSKDDKSDVALIQIDEVNNLDEELPMVEIGTSSTLRPGEFVIAIGSPMQLQNSVALGIVSATARHASELGLSGKRSEYIQIDLPSLP